MVKAAVPRRKRPGAEVGAGTDRAGVAGTDRAGVAGVDRAADMEMDKEEAREVGMGADKDKARVMEMGREMETELRVRPVWLGCRI